MNNLLEYNNYYASVNFSTDDGVFYGKIIGIDDLVIFEDASVEGLKKVFEEAVEDYLELIVEIA